jgi:hypothetical protein
MSEEAERPDHVVAKEYWDGFLARNASIIVDLMYGQLKSTVTCLTCGRIATAFDPYLSVCLPIIKEEKLDFSFAAENSHRKVTMDGEDDYELNSFKMMELAVSKSMKISDVKTQMISMMNLEGVNQKDMVVCNIKGNKVNSIYADKTSCFDIEQDRYERTMVYHVPGLTAETEPIEVNFFKMAKRGKTSLTVDSVDKSAPRFLALTKESTLMDVKR